MKKIYISADHAGVNTMEAIEKHLLNKNINVERIAINNHSSDDYPDFAIELGIKVREENTLGILICGNGIGISIAANKVLGIRCARVLTEDDAYKSKNHNGANVIALSANNSNDINKCIVDKFIETPSTTEERHLRRISKIENFEKGLK